MSRRFGLTVVALWSVVAVALPAVEPQCLLLSPGRPSCRTVSFYNTHSGASMQMVQKLHLYIHTSTHKTITLDVDDNYTIADIKAEIQDKEGITPDKQQLFYVNTQQLYDYSTLSDYGIRDGATLRLVVRLQIFVETGTGAFNAMEVDDDCTIGSVMARIAEKAGIPVYALRLAGVNSDWPRLHELRSGSSLGQSDATDSAKFESTGSR